MKIPPWNLGGVEGKAFEEMSLGVSDPLTRGPPNFFKNFQNDFSRHGDSVGPADAKISDHPRKGLV